MGNPKFKNADSILSVTLRRNQFGTDEKSFVGRVTRNTLTLENLIASLSEKNSGVDSYMIEHVAGLLGDEILAACRNGNAVDVLGLGIMYISVAGSVSGENPGEASIPGFKLNFTPSASAQKAVDSLKVDKVVIADSSPAIDSIINTFNQNEERSLFKGKAVKITGLRLKLSVEGSGIWFAPVDDGGNVIKDESEWVKVDMQTLSCNLPKTLEFYVPDDISASEYKIVIRTRFCTGDKELKSLVSAVSKTVTVSKLA